MTFKMKGSSLYGYGNSSPAKQTKPDVEGEKKVMTKRKKDVEDHRKNAPKITNTQAQADELNKIETSNVNAFNFSADSIQSVHDKYNLEIDKKNKIIRKNKAISDSTSKANKAAYDKYIKSRKKK